MSSCSGNARGSGVGGWEGGRWPLFHAIFGSKRTVEANLEAGGEEYFVTDADH